MMLAHAKMTGLEHALGKNAGSDRMSALTSITERFFREHDALTDEQLDLFDQVILIFANAIETRARVHLSERIASCSRPPPKVLRSLAGDQIVVARPVLTRAPALADPDLIEIASTRSRDHQLAIAERAAVSERVAELLVAKGDGTVRQRIASNPGARLSTATLANLIDKSRSDEALQDCLGERTDLSDGHMRQLVEVAKETARRRLLTTLSLDIDEAVEASAADLRPPTAWRDYTRAKEVVGILTSSGTLAEGAIADLAERGLVEATILALSHVTALSVDAVEQVFDEAENDLLIVIGRACGWNWRTVRALLQLRTPALRQRHQFRRAEATFDAMTSTTAQRVVHFLRSRSPGQSRSPAGSPASVKARV
jgi:hypothetical protein